MKHSSNLSIQERGPTKPRSLQFFILPNLIKALSCIHLDIPPLLTAVRLLATHTHPNPLPLAGSCNCARLSCITLSMVNYAQRVWSCYAATKSNNFKGAEYRLARSISYRSNHTSVKPNPNQRNTTPKTRKNISLPTTI